MHTEALYINMINPQHKLGAKAATMEDEKMDSA